MHAGKVALSVDEAVVGLPWESRVEAARAAVVGAISAIIARLSAVIAARAARAGRAGGLRGVIATSGEGLHWLLQLNQRTGDGGRKVPGERSLVVQGAPESGACQGAGRGFGAFRETGARSWAETRPGVRRGPVARIVR